jgi:hypothetical protein
VSISDPIGPRQRESFVIQRRPNAPIRFQLGLSGWTAIAGGLLIAAAIAAIAFFALGLFILVLPVLLIAPMVRYFLRKPNIAQNPTAPNGANGITIDGNFRVIDRGGATEQSERR